MSFYLAAIGTKDEIVAQLGAQADRVKEDTVGGAIRRALIEAFTAEEVTPYQGYENRYTVTANGHQGSPSLLSLSVQVQGQAVPVPQKDPIPQE